MPKFFDTTIYLPFWSFDDLLISSPLFTEFDIILNTFENKNAFCVTLPMNLNYLI